MTSSTKSGRLDAVPPSIEDLEKSGQYMATSPLQQKANDVRANRVNWQSYLQGQMISQEDYGIITKLDGTTADVRAAILKENPNQCAKMFLTMMAHMAKDQTLQYILTMIDDILQEDKSRVEIFREYARKNKESVWTPFLSMLNRTDGFIINQTSRVIAKIACWGKELMEGSDLTFYFTWLKDQMRHSGNEHLQTVARCLQMMLRINEYRHEFVKVEGITAIMQTLSGKVGFQIQYQLTYCLWILTFDPVLADRISKGDNTIQVLADMMSEAAKDKVTRIILATFRNLLEKPTEKEIKTENALAMVQWKVLKQLQLLEGRKSDDTEFMDDIQFLNEALQAIVQDQSSFDEYASEVRSGRLEWSPVHRCEKFWRENAARLCEKNFELLKILIKLLETSKDPLIISVAVHDLGEYVRLYPRGKTLIETLGGKTLIMALLAHDDPNVRYESLLAVQKLMVHNWEYLGKQLETPAAASKDGSSGQTAAKA